MRSGFLSAVFPEAHIGPGLPVPESLARKWFIRAFALTTLSVTGAYLVWRVTGTIDMGYWWVALPFLVTEVRGAVNLALFTVALWDIDVRPPHRVVDVTSTRVAVLIPTYNEAPDVLLPTIAAATRLLPAHETWVLDDGRREDIKRLAEQLGARYLARPTNEHAKAGNLNYALARVEADLVAIFDADHVPAPDFLRNTLGYFDDPRVAIVQTPQDFYNEDSFEHEGAFSEERIFYRAIAAGKNRWNAAFWAGTCAVVRCAALADVGGVATDAITEDILTSMRMQRRGWRTVYHNEVLARGLAPSDAARYLVQRNRWARGSMQVMRKEGPLRVSGLSAAQRIAYVTTFLGWFDSIRVLAYIILPLVVIGTGASAISAPLRLYVPIFALVLLLNLATHRLLARGYFRPQLSLVFAIVQMCAVLPSFTALVGGTHKFQVTPKGRAEGRETAAPPTLLVVLLVGSFLATVWYAATMVGLTPVRYADPIAPSFALAFNLINAKLLLSAIHRIRSPKFAGELRNGFRFPHTLRGTLDGRPVSVRDVSISGMAMRFDSRLDFLRMAARSRRDDKPLNAVLSLPNGDIELRCRLRRADRSSLEFGLEFESDQAPSLARLVPALFDPRVSTAASTPGLTIGETAARAS